ncbi:MAG: sulfatase, partial [Planctomycetota bacterium]
MRRVLPVLIVGALFCVFVDRGLAADRPNVLMIISDDQAWTDYSFMDHPVIRTPNLDRLAKEGVTYTRGYVPDSLCRPSLATMITGLYPHQHGITGNDPRLPDPNVRGMTGRRNPKYTRYYETLMHRIEEHPTLPRLLKQAGYVSFQSGKWWEGNHRRGGFDEGMTHGDPARGGRHGDAGLTIGRQGLDPVIDFMDRAVAEKKPFFVWYAPFMPHAPHTPPEELLAKYLPKAPTPAVARYWAMCEWFDQTCGELLDYLDTKGIAKDTLVVYVCDNGWIQDPDTPNRYAPRSKRSPYEG